MFFFCRWHSLHSFDCHVNAGFRLACRYRPVITACCFMVTALSGHAALAYHWAASLPSWIEVNCMQSVAVGKAARLSIYWQDAAWRLVIPLWQVALVQLYKYHDQSGKAASGKLAWKQHKYCVIMNMYLIRFYTRQRIYQEIVWQAQLSGCTISSPSVIANGMMSNFSFFNFLSITKFCCVELQCVYILTKYRRNLKGESVMVAILLSHMEVNYCTSESFHR